jgi:hypothetical protein
MKKPMGYKHGTEPGAGPLGGAGRAARGLGALGAAAVGKLNTSPTTCLFQETLKTFLNPLS